LRIAAIGVRSIAAHTASTIAVPPRNEIEAASHSEPVLRASIALVGAWVATPSPAIRARRTRKAACIDILGCWIAPNALAPTRQPQALADVFSITVIQSV
jgi:hypothetical protein